MRKEMGRHQGGRSIRSKSLALLLACVLLIGGVVGGTVAWLTAETTEVTNTFSTSDIGVELQESEATYKMIPGWTIEKDPKAKVTSGSEDCYLFIKVEESGGNVTVADKTYTFDDFIAYAIEEGWDALGTTTYPGIYYKVIDEASEKNVDYNILGSGEYTGTDKVKYTWADNEVLTKPEVSKEMMAAVNTGNAQPTLTFTAYAHQLYKNNTDKFSAAEAWTSLNTPATP